MKKLNKIVTLSLTILTILGTSIPVQAATSNITSSSSVQDIGVYGALSYEKTIIKTYSKVSSIPDSISYSEYKASYEFKGTLYVESVTKVNGKYSVVFKGTLFSSGL